jgi:hypothetical protein
MRNTLQKRRPDKTAILMEQQHGGDEGNGALPLNRKLRKQILPLSPFWGRF